MKYKASEVLEHFAKADLAMMGKTHTRKQLKISKKKIMSTLRSKLLKDSKFKQSVSDICKYGWDLAYRKQLLRRKFDDVRYFEFIGRKN